MDGDRERERGDLDRDLDRDADPLWASGGDGGVLDLLVFEARLLEEEDSLDLGGGEEEPRGAGDMLRERDLFLATGLRERALGAGLLERALGAGLRDRRGERDADRPRDLDLDRDELSDLERLLDLFLFASMSLIFLPLISFPDSFSRAFFRSL